MTLQAVCLIQARMSSSRLPGKVLANIEGKPMIQHVVDRCNKIYGARNPIVIASEMDLDSDQLINYCANNDIMALPISVEPEDVLSRYYLAIEALNSAFMPLDNQIKVVIRVTADTPLLDIQLSEELLSMFVTNDYDYIHVANYPKGLALEVFTVSALEQAYHFANNPYDLEHVTPWIQENLKAHYLSCRTDKYIDKDYSVDSPAGLEQARRLLKGNSTYSVCKDLLI